MWRAARVASDSSAASSAAAPICSAEPDETPRQTISKRPVLHSSGRSLGKGSRIDGNQRRCSGSRLMAVHRAALEGRSRGRHGAAGERAGGGQRRVPQLPRVVRPQFVPDRPARRAPLEKRRLMAIDGRAVAALRGRFRGALLRPGEEGFDEARRTWNGAVDRSPGLIARCAGADDVVEAVRFAREHDLLASVRGGGHSIAGHSVCDGGLMIDLSLMKSVRLDDARTVTAAGGVLWGELDRATQPFGLATTGGIIIHTGSGGLTLGGGLGHLMRKHGLTVDNRKSVDLVTADAEPCHVDADADPELFGGLRGGGNFGIATAFEYQLHPVGPLVLGGPIFWPLDDAPDVLRFVRDFAADAPDELGITIGIAPLPPAPFIPPAWFGK